ncbi:MAG: SAP domain-containing protein, partial [Euryarchaeota archaeon]|nr:SAP domain-containing protein [Euryarchaeota archaeon]
APAYDKMTVAELRELLKAAGKPVSGKKADLITRLSE